MTRPLSLTVDEAVAARVLVVDPSAIVFPSVRIVPEEDDGTTLGPSIVGARARIRDGVILASGVTIAQDSTIGHNVVLRAGVSIGRGTVISHGTVIEKESKIGSNVRISSLTHLTGKCIVEDDVQIGARVVTINDNKMRWRGGAVLSPPIMRKGCRIGSGSTLLGGVEIGEGSVVGAGSLVTRSIPRDVVAYGVPSYIQRSR